MSGRWGWPLSSGPEAEVFNLMETKIKIRLVLICAVVGLVAGCESAGFLSNRSLLADSTLAGALNSADRALALATMEKALNSPASAPLFWRSAASEAGGASGIVRPGRAFLLGLTEGRTAIEAPVGLHTGTALETALGQYVLRRNGNVRLAPTTTARRLTTLARGTRVKALGRDNATDWYLVARDGVVLGYVYGPLLRKVAGEDLVLAGGPSVVPTYCRSFSYDLRLGDGRKESVQGVACRSSDGRWSLRSGLRTGV